MQESERPPTLDYRTPDAVTWRHGWGSLVVNAMSIALHVIVGLAFVLWGLRGLLL